jgi:GNAT superfamily N-acetyltransferase
MALATWWRGDPLPELPELASFSAARSTDVDLIAGLAELSQQEVITRFSEDNRLYLAYIDGVPTAYGWVATKEGRASEIHLDFLLAPGNYYLWDFKTLPAWRGHTIYPHLLQAIVRQEMQNAERFWILYAPQNIASAHGIMHAGFKFVGDFILAGDYITAINLYDRSERALAGAAVLNLPIAPNDETEREKGASENSAQ